MDEVPHSMAATCREREGSYDVSTFQLVTCANCFGYLFNQRTDAKPSGIWVLSYVPPKDLRKTEANIYVEEYRSEICILLSRQDCHRWIECCREAERCCQQQLEVKALQQDSVLHNTTKENMMLYSGNELKDEVTNLFNFLAINIA